MNTTQILTVKKLPSVHKFLFEVQVLSRAQLLNNEGVDIHTNVLPNARPRTDSKCNPWR